LWPNKLVVPASIQGAAKLPAAVPIPNASGSLIPKASPMPYQKIVDDLDELLNAVGLKGVISPDWQ
jgi:hypothetical protein